MGQPLAFAFLLEDSGFPLVLQAFKLTVTNNQALCSFYIRYQHEKNVSHYFPLVSVKSNNHFTIAIGS